MKMDNTPRCIPWLGFPYDSNIHHRARNAGKDVAPWHTLILSLRTMSNLVPASTCQPSIYGLHESPVAVETGPTKPARHCGQ
jgi:hypothetical protein